MLLLQTKLLKQMNTGVLFTIRHLSIVTLFAVCYYVVSHYYDTSTEKKTLQKPLSMLDSFYYSLVTQTTVGYGDIAPKTDMMKIITIAQLLTIYGVFVIELL